MKAKYGAIITDISGSFGGMTFGRNKDAAFIRKNPMQIKPQTGPQKDVRNIYNSAVVAWRNLSDTQRLQWQSAASMFTNQSNGYRYFITLYLQYSHAGAVVLTSPPTTAVYYKPVDVLFTANYGASEFKIGVSPVIAANQYCMVYATPPMSHGVTMSQKGLRLITVLTSASANPYNIWSEYVSTFGSMPPSTQCFFLYLRGIPRAVGGLSKDTGLSGFDLAFKTHF
jgi:hypothetical protein